jgi:hypothetical protein
MTAALIMVWVGETTSLDAHQPDLEGWAASRQLRLEQPVAEPPLPPSLHDDALAERIEGLLSEARTEAYSTDTTTAQAALDTAEGLLRGAPGLPESAFLMAEILHQRAMLVAPRDADAARELERRAVALTGARAAPFVARPQPRPPGAEAAPMVPGPAAPDASPANGTQLIGPLPADEVEIDGRDVGAVRTIPDGAHHVRVLRAGRLAWAGWVTAKGEVARIAVPTRMACSEEDLADLEAPPASRRPIACGEYAKARPVGPEQIEVALCHGSSCGPWLPWSRTWGASFEAPVHSVRPARGDSHVWILWTAAGVAAVVLGGFALVQAGAFEERGPTQEKFRFEPPRTP